MMTNLLKEKRFLVLCALLGLTLLSWLLNSAALLDTKLLGALLLILAFFKTRLIAIHYMEASCALLPIRIAFESWIILTGTTTIALYLA